MIHEECSCGASIIVDNVHETTFATNWRANHRHEPDAGHFDQEITVDTASWDAATARLAKTLANRRPIPLWDNSPAEPADPNSPSYRARPDLCPCLQCNTDAGVEVWWMVVCQQCGNKRCPHATDHLYACTGSNDPGQVGSVYGEQADPPAVSTDEPPAGTPVWWDGKWWVSDEAGAAYTSTLWAERHIVKFWKFMPRAVPAETPGGVA